MAVVVRDVGKVGIGVGLAGGRGSLSVLVDDHAVGDAVRRLGKRRYS